MVCLAHCAIAFVFFVSMVYMSFAVDKSTVKRSLMRQLSEQQKELYVRIIESRRNIYLQGFLIGLFLSFVAVMARRANESEMSSSKKSLSSHGGMWKDMCLAGSITFLTVYFYYILSPKPELMVVHLQTPCQRRAWAEIYRTMSYHYHVGLLLGVIGVMIFTRGVCQ